MKKIILLGPPGAGKGTQADLICNFLDIPKISTGDMLREAIASESDLGKKVADVLNLPDNLTQAVLMPVAYYSGSGFREASRLPLDEVLHWNGW